MHLSTPLRCGLFAGARLHSRRVESRDRVAANDQFAHTLHWQPGGYCRSTGGEFCPQRPRRPGALTDARDSK